MKPLRILLISGIAFVILAEFYVLLHEDSAPALQIRHYYTLENITVESIDHQERNASDKKPFMKYEGDVFGIVEHNNFSVLEFFLPASRTRGIASGDFDNDGWQDILLGTNSGILLYKNLGGRFALQDINMQDMPNLDFGIHVVAFVDIDNDGWQDIYVTSYGGKNYFLLNDKRGFQDSKVLEVSNAGAVVTLASSFGDMDKDGWLDFVNGNWLPLRFFSADGAETNKLVMNKNLDFQEEDLKEFSGQTLSVLFSDFTNDNTIDLMTGDEFDNPDNFYIGDGKGGLKEIKKSDGVIPVSAHFSMSMDVADFNNDLYMDIYITGISTYESLKENPCLDIQNAQEKKKCEKNFEIIRLVKGGNVEGCTTLTERRDRNECATMIILRLAVRQEDKSLCDKILEEYKVQRFACLMRFTITPTSREELEEDTEAIPQLPWQNALLEGSESGTFQETAEEKGVDNGFNSWNAKFADLDNDEWQDLYVASGEQTVRTGKSIFQPNIFFHNYEGQYFEAEQEEFGLENFGIIQSYTYIDIDNDGDLDIISAGLNGPIDVYINNETKNNSITFEFRDNKGNHFGIGNKIYVYYGENSERHQVREIKSGGGFLSFDAPIAHFGLGEYDKVNKIEVVWSTGERTTINKEFLANKKYVIIRGR